MSEVLGEVGRELVTTVVVTRDRGDRLDRVLSHHRGPVVVVDDASSGGSVDDLRRHHPEVELVVARPELGHERNLGVGRARTPYVAFARDDSWWEPGALDLAAVYFEGHERLGLIAATVLVGDDERVHPVSQRMARSPLGTAPDLPGPSVLGFPACGAVVRREAFLAAGGFRPVARSGTEEERLARDLGAAGWGVVFLPEVVAHQHPSVGPPPAAGARSSRAWRVGGWAPASERRRRLRER